MNKVTAQYVRDHLLLGIDHLAQVEYEFAVEEHTADSQMVLDARQILLDAMEQFRLVHDLLNGWAD